MESLLQLENITKSFGDRLLFSDVTFGINEGNKVGIIAKNGSGKSTLLKIICGSESADSGNVVYRNGVRVGYLEQLPQFDPQISVIDACIDGKDTKSQAIREYEIALRANDEKRLMLSVQNIDNLDAWDYEEIFKQTLSMLKISDYSQKIGELSGGQIKRVALSKIIIKNPDLLILDEPTNHLDIEMIEWLEDYLNRSKVALLMVTHDRYFLDRVCNKIIEIDNQQVYSYSGNYDYYLEKRQERIEAHNAETDKAKNLLRTELEWMRRQPQARGSKAKYRIDAFYKLEKQATQKSQDKDLTLNIKSAYIGSKIFVANNISKRYGDKIILNDFNYTFSRYEKLGIVGDNGVGKSTFLRLLLGEIKPDNGDFEIGETVKFGYYSQAGMQFDETKKVIDAISEIAEVIYFDEKTRYTASQFLQLFLFAPNEQQKPVAKLSGGEKRRLYLATVLMSKPNFLILDEPTNDLDIVTLEILEEYLHSFKGCVIIVSHDRFFMDKTVDHILVFKGEGDIRDFPGNYSEYRYWKTENEKKECNMRPNASANKQVSKGRPSRNDNDNRLTYKERIEFEALSQEISSLSSEKTSLEEIFNSNAAISDIAEKSRRYNELKALLDEKEMRWLELSEKEY